MTNSIDQALNLSARARRGEATAEEQKQLRSALTASATLKVSHQTGLDFDRELELLPSDAELIDRIAAGAAAKHGHGEPAPRARLRARGTSFWLIAAALFLASAGAAGALAWQWTRPAASPLAAPPRTPRGAASLMVSPRLPTPAEMSSSGPPAEVAAAPSAAMKPLAPRAKLAAPPAAEPALQSASDLFTQANRARAKSPSEAIVLYRKLAQQYPSAPETQTSRIALGRLLLASGDAASASQEFARYLQEGGTLVEEALAWRARSLGRLGDRAKEQETWAELVRRFPGSVYEVEARTRLGEGQTPGP